VLELFRAFGDHVHHQCAKNDALGGGEGGREERSRLIINAHGAGQERLWGNPRLFRKLPPRTAAKDVTTFSASRGVRENSLFMHHGARDAANVKKPSSVMREIFASRRR
jgi:hypothetical protein